MAILNNNPLVGASGNQGGYNINNSLRFRSSASASLSRTLASAGNRKTWTWSGWIKRGPSSAERFIFGNSTSLPISGFFFGSDNALKYRNYNGSIEDVQLFTTQVFRDPSAWYHLVVVLDTTQATASNRLKFYINGVQITAFGTATYPSLNSDQGISAATAHDIGSYALIYSNFDGYMAEVNFIDGQALTPSSFGETDTTTGVWKPKAYTGTYGTNGFYLKFSDIATTSGSNAGLGKDFSGNSNYWTTNNISVTSGSTYDAMTDSPTNTSATVANYCVWNPLNSGATLSEGNLTATTSAWTDASGSMAMPSGKWYAEFTYNSSTSTNALVGITLASFNGTGQSDTFRVAYQTIGTISRDGVASPADLTGYPTYTLGDIIGIALDVSAGTITFYKNNSSVYTLTTSVISSNEWRFFVRMNTRSFIANFGQRPFAYTPPTGFVRLNTFNLPTPTILQGNKYMDATLYTGNGTNRSITNAGAFKPDAIWIKTRSAGAYNHHLVDSVRGANKNLRPNLTGAEDTTTDQVTAINSNGFSLGVDTAGPADSEVNVNGNTYVAWQWQAGQGSTSSNTNGSITSTVSVNTTAGFSVVTYTGTGANATVGHGLGVAPKMVIVKNRSSNSDWLVQNANLSSYAYALILSGANAQNNAANWWNSTAPTSSVFSVGDGSIAVNGSGSGMVAYCWAEIAGFSKFGSYTGNGSTDGPMVYCNFSPRFLMVKRTDTTGNWRLIDTARYTYNTMGNELYPNSSAAEAYNAFYDVLSNGFKMRNTNTDLNASGGTYIFMAFSSNPFKNSLAR